MNLFDIAASHISSTGEAITVSDLADRSGADVHFLRELWFYSFLLRTDPIHQPESSVF
jgi:hypothetical protein